MWLMLPQVAASLGNLGVHHKRIPEWVLPNSMLALHCH